MTEYEGILSGIAQRIYQRYLDRERKIQAKQTTERQKRKDRLEAHLKRSAGKTGVQGEFEKF